MGEPDWNIRRRLSHWETPRTFKHDFALAITAGAPICHLHGRCPYFDNSFDSQLLPSCGIGEDLDNDDIVQSLDAAQACRKGLHKRP